MAVPGEVMVCSKMVRVSSYRRMVRLPGALVLTLTSTVGGSMDSVRTVSPFCWMCALGAVHSQTGRYRPAPEYHRELGWSALRQMTCKTLCLPAVSLPVRST